ncbi:MAG: DUF1844 domain-containing protein [candidate division Zixibacteria bacterium]|nr:DUF1844 domain-containing protein [candidate division Zixibacteria bacterium]
MNQQELQINPLFLQLVVSLQAGAMQQMGKVASPFTGKVERDLDMAKHSIDMLAMIDDKTKGNLGEEEQKLLSHLLYELRLNYVDELKKEGEARKEKTPSPESKPTEEAAASEDSATTDSTSTEDSEKPDSASGNHTDDGA